MNVKDLIKALELFPPHMEVGIMGDDQEMEFINLSKMLLVDNIYLWEIEDYMDAKETATDRIDEVLIIC